MPEPVKIAILRDSAWQDVAAVLLGLLSGGDYSFFEEDTLKSVLSSDIIN